MGHRFVDKSGAARSSRSRRCLRSRRGRPCEGTGTPLRLRRPQLPNLSHLTVGRSSVYYDFAARSTLRRQNHSCYQPSVTGLRRSAPCVVVAPRAATAEARQFSTLHGTEKRSLTSRLHLQSCGLPRLTPRGPAFVSRPASVCREHLPRKGMQARLVPSQGTLLRALIVVSPSPTNRSPFAPGRAQSNASKRAAEPASNVFPPCSG